MVILKRALLQRHLICGFKNKIIEHNLYIRQYGLDMPELENWTWESAMKNIKEEK